MLKELFNKNIKNLKFYLLFIPLSLGLIIEIVSTTLLPSMRKPIFDALTAFNYTHFLVALLFLGLVYVSLLGAQSVKSWLVQKIAFILREQLMYQLKLKWLTKLTKRTALKTNTICSRLNDDIRISTETMLGVFIEVFISCLIVIGLMLTMLTKPVLLITALGYSGISILLAFFFRKPIVNSKVNHLNSEGRHRVELTVMSKKISKVNRSDYLWKIVKEMYIKYINILLNYKIFTAIQTSLMIIIPFLVLAPSYFHHVLTLGDIMEGTAAFDLLVVNTTLWVQLYPQITEAQASWFRVKELNNELSK